MDGAGIKRAMWTTIGYMVDVRVLQGFFDAAINKLWVEIAGAADATRCSYIEPAIPRHHAVGSLQQLECRSL